MSQMKCPNCGAQMDVHPDKDFQFCSYCGTKIRIQDLRENAAGAAVKITKDYLAYKTEKTRIKYAENEKKREVREKRRQKQEEEDKEFMRKWGWLAILLLVLLLFHLYFK